MNSIVEEIENEVATDRALLFGDDDVEGDGPSNDGDPGDTEGTASGDGDGDSGKAVEEPGADEDVPKGQPETGEGEQPPEEKQRDGWIPRKRFDEVHAKVKVLEEELDRQKAAATIPDKTTVADTAAPSGEVDIVALERQFYSAYDAGEDEKAFQIRQQINDELIRRAEARVEQKLTEREQRQAAERLQQEAVKAANAVIAKYPALNENDQNNPLMDEVIEWRDFYTMKGHTVSDAIRKAADKVMGAAVKTDQPEESNQPPIDQRKQSMIKRNVDAANRQPPRLQDGVGDRNIADPLQSAVNGKQEDWEKLPESERKKLLE